MKLKALVQAKWPQKIPVTWSIYYSRFVLQLNTMEECLLDQPLKHHMSDSAADKPFWICLKEKLFTAI
jgi:hypothetical protein